MIAKIDWPTSLEAAQVVFHQNQTKHTKQKTLVKIGHNTQLYKPNPGKDVILALYHGNPIIRYTPLTVEISSAGWNTMTTAQRLHGALQALHLTDLSVNKRKDTLVLTRETSKTIIPDDDWLQVW